ncbi:hypothetical protein SASPL_131193 [Salvia splendens]|uniref:Uncharacterized protein n=1 Tax=Salvia splendens TaxID=180675 RepID=A0A8X8X8T4_SALSN|nr:hypothetical protein SASPL_131193 [Salvia splendens]
MAMEDVVRRARNLKRDTKVEVYSNIDNQSNLIIAQRSQGMWLVQLPERNESHKMEKGLHQQFSQEGLTNRSTSTWPRPEARGPQSPPRSHETASNLATAPRFSKNLSSQSLNADHVSLLALLYLLLAASAAEESFCEETPSGGGKEDIVSSPFDEEMDEFPPWLNEV